MADQSKLLFVNADGEHEESTITDALKYSAFKTTLGVLSDDITQIVLTSYDTLASEGNSKNTSIYTGNTTDANAQSGFIEIVTGDSDGDSGYTFMRSGDSANGNSGHTVLTTGAAANGTRGQLKLDGSLISLFDDGVITPSGHFIKGTDGFGDFLGLRTEALASAATTRYVFMRSGSNTGTGNTGQVVVRSGDASQGDAGDVIIRSGSAVNGTCGDITLRAGLNNLSEGAQGVIYLIGDYIDATGNAIKNVLDPVAAQDAATKAYVDAVAIGLRPKGNVRVATTANITINSAPASIDGVTLSNFDRILVKDQTNATENGIYVFQGAGNPLTRSTDQDNSPLAEVLNGVFIPQVLEGTVNQGRPYVITSVGSGTDGLHVLGTDDVVFEIFSSPSQLVGGNGINIVGNSIEVDFLTGGGLKFVGDQLAVEPADFAGAGLVDDGSDNLAIDWYSPGVDNPSITSKAVKVSDLAGNGAGQGANVVGVDPASISNSSSTDLQSVLEDLDTAIVDAAEEGVEVTVGTGGVAKGDLVNFSGNDTVVKLDVSTNAIGFGLAKAAQAAAGTVKVLNSGEVITGVLVGATAGNKYYWNGTTLTTTIPTASGSRVWQVGIAKNATDLLIDIEFIKKNS